LKDLDALPTQDATGPQPSNGGAESKRPGFAAARAIAAGEQKYSQIPVPVLAIFALPHDWGTDNPQAAAAEARDIASLTGPQAKAFEIGVPSARVVRLPHASHYVFQSNESDVIREMNSFIRPLAQR